MDPEATLKEMRELSNKILGGDRTEETTGCLAELVVAYDEWVRRGGFVPKAKGSLFLLWVSTPGWSDHEREKRLVGMFLSSEGVAAYTEKNPLHASDSYVVDEREVKR